MKKKTLVRFALIAAGVVPVSFLLFFWFAANFMVFSANTCDGPIYRLVQNSKGMSKARFAAYVKEQGLNVNESCGSGITPLHEAVGENPDAIAYLVELGVHVNVQSEGGGTPLHWATQFAVGNGDLKAMKALLKGGADPHIPDTDGNTPLHYAVEKTPLSPSEQAEIVKLLLEHGADPSTKNKEGLSPLEIVDSRRAAAPQHSRQISKIMRAYLCKR